MNLEPVQKTTLAESVTQKIIHLIQNGHLKPGDRLPSQKELMVQMGVGRSSIREAVQRLLHLNILQSHPGKGTFVNEVVTDVGIPPHGLSLLLARNTLAELIEVRFCLETRTAFWAAQKATDEDLEAMKAALREFEEALRSDRFSFDANAAFHIALAKASRNRFLVKLLENVLAALYTLREESEALLHGSREDQRKALERHKQIYKAIQERQPEEAQRWMQKHFEDAQRMLEETEQIIPDGTSRDKN
jgi:GntR family transcriptional repressor for pyruvate dehydrogenase complex